MSRFTVVTWNVENLFAFGQGGGPDTRAAYDHKLDTLASVIRQLDPDVFAFQEMGGEDPADDLRTRLDKSVYAHSALGVPDGRGIRNGYFSKLPFASAPRDITEFPDEGLAVVGGVNKEGEPTEVRRLGRGGVHVTVEPVSGLKVHLINLHLKSKLLTFPNPGRGRPRFQPRNENERARIAAVALLKRTAEATAVRVEANKVLEPDTGDALVVLGDFNDVVEAATTQITKGPPGSEIDSTPRAFNTPDTGDATRLFNLAPLILGDRRYSRIYKRNKELIDHIFVSEELLPGRPRRTPQVDSHVDILDGLPSISENPTERLGEPGSDHAPISAIFEIA